MQQFWTIVFIIWLPVFFLFLGLIIGEAKKREVPVNWRHIVVAVFWPLWLIWYVFVLAKEKISTLL